MCAVVLVVAVTVIVVGTTATAVSVLGLATAIAIATAATAGLTSLRLRRGHSEHRCHADSWHGHAGGARRGDIYIGKRLHGLAMVTGMGIHQQRQQRRTINSSRRNLHSHRSSRTRTRSLQCCNLLARRVMSACLCAAQSSERSDYRGVGTQGAPRPMAASSEARCPH